MLVVSNCFANLCPFIRPLDMIPVSEVQIPFNLSVALKLCFFCYHGSSSQITSVRRKTSHASVQLLFGRIAIFVRRELLFCSYRRFPQNRGNGVAVFEGSPIRYNNAFSSSSLLYEPLSIGKQLAQFLSKLEWRNKIDNFGKDYRLVQFLEVLRYCNHTAYGTASEHSILLNVVP